MVNAVNGGMASMNTGLTTTDKTVQPTTTTETVTPTSTTTLESDTVTISDEAKAAMLGDPDWPEPPKKEQ